MGLLAGHSVSDVNRKQLTGSKVVYQHDFRMLALRAGVHTHRWIKWQAYGGIVLGYQDNRINKYETNKGTTAVGSDFQQRKPSHFFYSAFMGSAFHPVPQLEIFGELGFGLSILTMGIGYSW